MRRYYSDMCETKELSISPRLRNLGKAASHKFRLGEIAELDLGLSPSLIYPILKIIGNRTLPIHLREEGWARLEQIFSKSFIIQNSSVPPGIIIPIPSTRSTSVAVFLGLPDLLYGELSSGKGWCPSCGGDLVPYNFRSSLPTLKPNEIFFVLHPLSDKRVNQLTAEEFASLLEGFSALGARRLVVGGRMRVFPEEAQLAEYLKEVKSCSLSVVVASATSVEELLLALDEARANYGLMLVLARLDGEKVQIEIEFNGAESVLLCEKCNSRFDCKLTVERCDLCKGDGVIAITPDEPCNRCGGVGRLGGAKLSLAGAFNRAIALKQAVTTSVKLLEVITACSPGEYIELSLVRLALLKISGAVIFVEGTCSPYPVAKTLCELGNTVVFVGSGMECRAVRSIQRSSDRALLEYFKLDILLAKFLSSTAACRKVGLSESQLQEMIRSAIIDSEIRQSYEISSYLELSLGELVERLSVLDAARAVGREITRVGLGELPSLTPLWAARVV